MDTVSKNETRDTLPVMVSASINSNIVSVVAGSQQIK